MQKRLKGIIALMALAGGAGILATFMLMWVPALAADAAGSAGRAVPEGAVQWGFLAAALAIGAIAEKPEMLGRTLIMVGLAEGIAIYGLIISILIFNQIM